MDEYRNDPLLFLNSDCAVEQVVADPEFDCTSDITRLCDGIRNCDECSDENDDLCVAFKCAASKKKPNLLNSPLFDLRKYYN